MMVEQHGDQPPQRSTDNDNDEDLPHGWHLLLLTGNGDKEKSLSFQELKRWVEIRAECEDQECKQGHEGQTIRSRTTTNRSTESTIARTSSTI